MGVRVGDFRLLRIRRQLTPSGPGELLVEILNMTLLEAQFLPIPYKP